MFEVGDCVVGSAAVMATRIDRAVSFISGEGVGTRDRRWMKGGLLVWGLSATGNGDL